MEPDTYGRRTAAGRAAAAVRAPRLCCRRVRARPASTTAGRRGHPVLFSDRVARRVDGLPEDRGLNSLWEDPELHLREFELEKSGILFDIDTPDDYANALDRVRNSPF